MYRNYREIKYTEADLEGFHFEMLNKQDMDEVCSSIRQKRNKTVLLYLLLAVFCLIAVMIGKRMPTEPILEGVIQAGIVLPDLIEIIGMSLTIFFLLAAVIAAGLYKQQEKGMHAKDVRCIRVQIIEKLPIEHQRVYSAVCNPSFTLYSHDIHFYPVIGQDIATKYKSVCYVPEEGYQKDIGTVVRIIKKGN